ncbi:MAG: 4-hydroxy-3-methylbut-2-enyl diphosphate reductase [Lentisphaeria bacterium]|nr:4-hydroxy-3-methylbut-2-enyl diphosphate reductase [Lentisphaeria bacterium]
MTQDRHLFLAEPHGFCNGVRRALDMVENALAAGKSPLYVLHEIVHNNFVVQNLRAKGVLFVNDPDEVPDGAFLVVSAHGASPAVYKKASPRLHVIDATCPLVRKVQLAAEAASQNGERVLLLGHADHPEVAGIVGHCIPGTIDVLSPDTDWSDFVPEENRGICLLSQTTLNADDVAAAGKLLAGKFSSVRNGAEVCYATRDRQQAVRRLAKQVEFMFILGSSHSSNSRRLLETALKENISAKLVDLPEEIGGMELENIRCVGLTAGASVPDELIGRAVKRLESFGFPLAAPEKG